LAVTYWAQAPGVNSCCVVVMLLLLVMCIGVSREKWDDDV